MIFDDDDDLAGYDGEPEDEYGIGWKYVYGYFRELGFADKEYTRSFARGVSRFLHSSIQGHCKDRMRVYMEKKIKTVNIWDYVVDTVPVHAGTGTKYTDGKIEASVDLMSECFMIDGLEPKRVSWPDPVQTVRKSIVSTLNYIHFFPHHEIENILTNRIAMRKCWEFARNNKLFVTRDSKSRKPNLTRRLVQILEEEFPEIALNVSQLDQIKQDLEGAFLINRGAYQGDWQYGWSDSWSIFRLATSGKKSFHKWLWNKSDKNYQRIWGK